MRLSPRHLRLLPVVLLLATTAPLSSAQSAPPNGGLPTITLRIGNTKLTAEVAAAPSDRATGLMHRFSLPPDHGMLFVFETPQPLAFWMKNTHIPLSIAYLDAQGKILNIEDMAPQTLNGHCSRRPVRYALEMNQGWFAKRGIKPGFKLKGPPFGT